MKSIRFLKIVNEHGMDQAFISGKFTKTSFFQKNMSILIKCVNIFKFDQDSGCAIISVIPA